MAQEMRQSGGSLTFTKVARRFGRHDAVADFSLEIAAGEVICLLGASGCGKTTTLRIAAGLERADAGEVSIDGRIVESASVHVPPEKRGVGLMFQDFALFPHLKVIDNVAFGLRDMPAQARRARAMDLLARVGMARHAASYPHQLSGGEQQRIALARALAPSPRILLMDEPFSGLDPMLRDQVRGDTFRLLKGLGTTVLLVTHDPGEAMNVADRIALMRHGRLVQLGTPSDIFDHPVDREAAGFFGELNIIHAFVRSRHAPTAFGDIPCAALAEGTEVEVLVRPHALRLAREQEAGTAVRVVSSRRAGRDCLVDFEISPASLPQDAPSMPVLRARLSESAGMVPGDTVELTLDKDSALVFPCRHPARGPSGDAVTTLPTSKSDSAALHRP